MEITKQLRRSLLLLAAISLFRAGAQEHTPPWVPKVVGPDGRYTPAGMMFSTRAYEQEALRLVIQEANQVARDLSLPEKLPITASNLEQTFIVRFGMAQTLPKAIGSIHTHDYGYFVSVDHKLSFVTAAHQDEDCIKYREDYTWPTNRLDTNAPYRLATQWLAAARMDVKALNRDCKVQVQVNPFWNGLRPGEKLRKKTFVPIYDVSWASPRNRTEGYGCTASVSLFYPTTALLDLSVFDSKYILRKPLVFTNLYYLLSQTNDATSSQKVPGRP